MAQNVIFMVFDVFDLDLDISRSFDFCAFTIFPCMTDVIFEGISSLLAEIYNIEIWKNSLYFIMGIFHCHGNVRYVFLIDAIFCKVHSIGPNNMCIKFEKNRLRIDDFRKSEKIVCFIWRHVAQKRVRQNRVPWQKRHDSWNVFQPTRSLYDFRFKSYGPLCDFYKSGDLDLDLNPIFTKKLYRGTWNCVHELYKFQKERTSGVACTIANRRTNKQTNKWKGTQRVHTLQNWTYRLSDLPCRLTVTKVKDTINWS